MYLIVEVKSSECDAQTEGNGDRCNFFSTDSEVSFVCYYFKMYFCSQCSIIKEYI